MKAASCEFPTCMRSITSNAATSLASQSYMCKLTSLISMYRTGWLTAYLACSETTPILHQSSRLVGVAWSQSATDINIYI